MTVIRAIFPWPFPDPRCIVCGQPVEFSAALPQVDATGKDIGLRHDDCELPE